MCSLFTFPLTHFTFSAFSHLSPLVFPLFFSSGSLFLPRLRLCLLSFFFFFLHSPSTRSEARNFCLGGPSCNTNIFIKTTLIYIYIYIHTHAHFLLYTHTHIYTLFYLISYINTPTQHQKKKGLSTFNQSYV